MEYLKANCQDKITFFDFSNEENENNDFNNYMTEVFSLNKFLIINTSCEKNDENRFIIFHSEEVFKE